MGVAVAAVSPEMDFHSRRRAKNGVERKDVFALLQFGFGKSLVKHSSPSQPATGWRCVANAAPHTNSKPQAVAGNKCDIIDFF